MSSITTERTATSNLRTKLEYINDHNIIIQWNHSHGLGWTQSNAMQISKKCNLKHNFKNRRPVSNWYIGAWKRYLGSQKIWILPDRVYLINL